MYFDPDYNHGYDFDLDYNYKFQFSIEKSYPQDQNLRIQNIHVSITEEMLWSKFKEYGNLLKLEIARDKTTCKSLEYGFITFKTAKAAKHAIKALNFTFLRNCEDFPNQKRVQISYDIDLEQYKQIKDKGITLLGIPKQNIDYNHFYNHQTQYGEILLSQLREKDQEYQCYIVYKEQEDLIKFLQFQNNFEYQGHKITVQNLNLFQKSNKKCVYIENFYRDLTDSESQTTESRKKAADTIKTYLIDKISKYGEISYCTVSFDPYTKKKPYAFLSMKFIQNLEHLLQLYNQNKQEIISLGFSKNIIINEKK